MSKKYNEYKSLNLPQIADEMLAFWEKEKIFEKSISSREGKESFVFYEGPPSANGLPGIHHVMARSIKDIFCRYKTLKGFQVNRKAGWDTHGLPIELSVEKSLGITKEDIGKKISIEEYNNACRKEVMKYTDKWEELTKKMGYWVDMKHPYITYENKYIESVWYLLNELYKKNFLYKGFTIQPYSPAAGTGLSTHELNQPGCYRNVKDRTAVVMFKVKNKTEKFKEREAENKIKFDNEYYYYEDIIKKESFLNLETYFLAWTTTPWTLPSNTALAVGGKIEYIEIISRVDNINFVKLILATDLFKNYFKISGENKNLGIASCNLSGQPHDIETNSPEGNFNLKLWEEINKTKLWIVSGNYLGSDLAGIKYEQLLPFEANKNVELNGDEKKWEDAAGKVIIGDFVTTTDGTGIVHIAPSFGADDFRAAKQNGIGSLTLVDKRGKFLPEVKDDIFLYGEEYVKEAYLTDQEKEIEFKKQKQILEKEEKIKDLKNYLSVDERIVLKLQEEGKLFKKESYEHSYPHCWRTDKPILYYPLDSWFVKTTALKDRMIELNKTINWKPESTGTGRFGNWLENLQDWNLSRSRYWGIPIPIWTSEDKTEQICIGSAEHLQKEIENAVAKKIMNANPLKDFEAGNFSKENYDSFDLHRPYADEIFLEKNGKKLFREADLIDVWFDSGSMPYAQLHYPFENKNLIDQRKNFPADFIAEGVDQTRGWFFTLHAISTMCFDSVAYKNVISNGLVLDKNGNKMSKRLGNAADPFETLKKYGADATRWYMITNASPWDNLKFDLEGISEVQRKFFGTLYNTYNFFALYANIDGFNYSEKEIPIENRPEIDRWILSELHSLIKNVNDAFADYEPTKAGRAIEYFLDEHLSNWYVRLCRRRFWKGEYSADKIAAYQTLYQCLETIAQLASPIAPFFMEKLFLDLNTITKKHSVESVHLSYFPEFDKKIIDVDLEERMELAQKISSMVLSIRKKENIRVRQPLNKIQIPVLDDSFQKKIEGVKELILSEVNVKNIDFVYESTTSITKNLKLNFKTLGKKCGKHMKSVQTFAAENAQLIISSIEKTGKFELKFDTDTIVLENEDVEIIPVDIPGWKVANTGQLTVALDVTITSELKEEGIARELVNRIQNLRKETHLDVTDKISVKIQRNIAINAAISNNFDYICSETLASSLEMVDELKGEKTFAVDVNEDIKTLIYIDKLN
ncbi:MAG: isoleucine--tRNA ligase [Bacteroidia bacterium]